MMPIDKLVVAASLLAGCSALLGCRGSKLSESRRPDIQIMPIGSPSSLESTEFTLPAYVGESPSGGYQMYVPIGDRLVIQHYNTIQELAKDLEGTDYPVLNVGKNSEGLLPIADADVAAIRLHLWRP